MTGDISVLRDGPWFGHICVKFRNQVVELFLNHPALQLHGEGEAAASEGKIVGQKCKALDVFVLRQMSRQAADFVLNQGVSARMSRKLGIGRKL